MPRTAEKASAKPTPKRQPRTCECGCSEQTKGGRFKPGHDARLKGQLLAKLREGNARDRTSAEKQLRAAGWEKFIPE